MVGPKPQDPRVAAPIPQEIEARVNEVLSRPAETLSEEAVHLEEAYRILNDALA
ncbi:MAG: hypothetical protein GX898_01425 [Corynebacterium sp.]|nr:hypothetical protein [Corynebacterium sp.]